MTGGDHGASIDELLDRAVTAINRGDQLTAATLAEQVLAVDRENPEAEDLLAVPDNGGEIRRLTILFADLVNSTGLSTSLEPEAYRNIVRRYHDLVRAVVARYEGHITSTKGDGLLAVFGHPKAHENDVRRSVLAALEIIREFARLAQQVKRRFGVDIAVRIGVHRGLVYLDTDADDVFGMAANLAQRVCGLAPPDSVVVSDAVAALIGAAFELRACAPAAVKGVQKPVGYQVVLGERADAARVGVGRGPLVDRERELARLRKSWQRAQANTLRTPGVVFCGESGIGKSRLAAAAVELAEESGGAVLDLIGSPFHTDAGLHPVRTLLERRCGIGRLTDPPERLRLLKAEISAASLDAALVAPLLAPVLGIGREAGYEPVASEGRKLYAMIATAVKDYLLSCAGSSAALIVAKDVHWFDPATVEILGDLLRCGSGRLLVVMTCQGVEWLPRSWPAKVFDLRPFSHEEADTLITALNPKLTPEEHVAVINRCDGVPFYIEQLVAGWRESHDRGADEVPDALYEPLLARLRATENALPVLEAAAVIGRQFDRRLLCSACTVSEDQVDDVIDELEDASVLEPTGADTWRFRHELLREVVCELAPASVRRALHEKVADALVHGAAGSAPDWTMVARHYEQAERPDNAASAYRQAAELAGRRGALAEERTHLTLALTQLDRIAAGPDRNRREIAMRLRRGFLAATIEGNQSRPAIADFERCLELGGTDLHDDELLATMVSLMVYYFTRADLRRVVRMLRVLRSSVDQGRQWLDPVIEASFGVVAWLRGGFNAAESYLEAAIPDLAANEQLQWVWYQPNDPITTARAHLALTRFVLGDFTGAETELAHALSRISTLGFPQGPFSAAFATFLEIWMRIEAGQLDRAAALADALTDQAERHGFDAWRLWGSAQQAAVRAVRALNTVGADPAPLWEHIASMTKLVDVLGRAGLNAYLTFFEAVLVRLLAAAGSSERAGARVRAALALAADTGMHFYDAELLRARAGLQADPDDRRTDLEAALEVARRQGTVIFELRAALDLFDLLGEPARSAVVEAVAGFPPRSRWPELARVPHGPAAEP